MNYLLYVSANTQGGQNKGENVTMTWIDYNMAYNMVLRTWLIECLKICKTSDKVLKFFMEVMKDWKVELVVGRQTLAEVKIKIGIF